MRRNGSERNHRPGQPRLSAIEKQPHAQSLRALHGHQAHLSANMVAIFEHRRERLVAPGIRFQSRNPFLYGALKPRADLIGFIDGEIGVHGWLLGAGFSEAEDFLGIGLKYFPLAPILTKTHERRKITKLQDLGNCVCKNEAGAEFSFAPALFPWLSCPALRQSTALCHRIAL